jgi:hypothetical protein
LIGVIATAVAWLVLVVCVLLLLLYVPTLGPDWLRLLLSGLVVLTGVSTFLQLFVTGNGLLLLNDVEYQARANQAALDRVTSMLETAQPPAAQKTAVQVETRAPSASAAPEEATSDNSTTVTTLSQAEDTTASDQTVVKSEPRTT